MKIAKCYLDPFSSNRFPFFFFVTGIIPPYILAPAKIIFHVSISSRRVPGD